MGPLAGKRIVEIAGIGPCPFAGMMLADMGADVVLVERKTRDGGTAGDGLDPRFTIMNRGKRSIAIDLKADGAVDVVLRLLAGADGLIEGFRPGVMERLGLGPDVCHAVNPRLVYGRMTGWGQTGPLAQAAGHDLNYIALSGAAWYGGRTDSPPTAPPTLVGDIGGGAMVLVVGLLAALIGAESTGRGQVVDAAVVDGSALATTLLGALYAAGLWRRERIENMLDGASPWYDTYECADGKFVSVAALEPAFYRQLIDKLGLAADPDFDDQYDARRWPAQKARVAALFRTKSRAHWCELLEGTDACFAPVLDFEEARAHPHNRARGVFTTVDGIGQPAPAPRFSETPSAIASPPPARGEHGVALLEAAGFSGEEIRKLAERGVI